MVHEAVINAVRHPVAKVLQTGSRFQGLNDRAAAPAPAPGKGGEAGPRPGFLTIVTWDDGDSIIDTFRAGARRPRRAGAARE